MASGAACENVSRWDVRCAYGSGPSLGRRDIMDFALDGQTAEIESVELDYENRVHLAVVLENDPGRDLGMLRQPGHRFFFSPDEVEPLENAS